MDLTTWTVVGAVATAFAALATTASAIVVGVQAYHTRRSAQASEDAVGVAQATLRESQLTRLEARAPHLHVSVVKYLFEEVTTREAVEHGSRTVTKEAGSVFRMPRDATKRLRTRADFAVRNNGSELIELKSSKPYMPREGSTAGRILLEPGEKFEGTFLVRNTLEEWIRLSKVSDGREEGDDLAFTFELTYTGPNDFDLDETMTIEVRGTIVEPVVDEGDGWQVQNVFDRDLVATLLPARRRYFRSRTKGEEF